MFFVNVCVDSEIATESIQASIGVCTELPVGGKSRQSGPRRSGAAATAPSNMTSRRLPDVVSIQPDSNMNIAGKPVVDFFHAAPASKIFHIHKH